VVTLSPATAGTGQLNVCPGAYPVLVEHRDPVGILNHMPYLLFTILLDKIDRAAPYDYSVNFSTSTKQWRAPSTLSNTPRLPHSTATPFAALPLPKGSRPC
jgi:hypothetical protein